MAKLAVSQLSIYPIKSAQEIKLNSMQLSEKGPQHDRRWMVIDNGGKFVTQRKHPKLCLLRTELDDGLLFMSIAGSEKLAVPFGNGQIHQSEVWGSEVSGYDCGDAAAEFLSTLLGIQARLIYMADDFARKVDVNFAKQNELVGFADGFPVLITTEASLQDFNSKLGYDIGMNRFRPNIVITGNLPYAEDQWQKIGINGIEFSLVKPCSRCIMPSVNPETAEKEMAVNQALLEHRRRETKTYFGQNAIYNRLGQISLGDEVQVLA